MSSGEVVVRPVNYALGYKYYIANPRIVGAIVNKVVAVPVFKIVNLK